MAVVLLAQVLIAQESAPGPLSRNLYRSGEGTLKAFAPVSQLTRDSIVKLNVNGETVALATIMDAGGFGLTKASEIKKGKLTAWLASEREVDAELLATDKDEDLALVQVHDSGLKPIQWAGEPVVTGEWAITPGIAETPQAVGIISALPRRIRPPQAYIGISWNLGTLKPEISELMEGFGAEKAGMKPGDLIVRVNGQSVTNRDQVVEIVREFGEGQTIKLALQRSGKEFEKEVTLKPPTAAMLELGGRSRFRGRLDGQVSQRAEGFERAIEHDTVLQPWLCGGPLVNLDGQALGINIAHASRFSTYALPVGVVKQIFETLRATRQ